MAPVWERANTKLSSGPHGIPPEVVERIQRDRLLRRMTETVAEHGFGQTTVRKVLDGSGIARRTYYGLYENKKDCFLDACREIAEELLERVGASYAAERVPARRLRAGLGAVVGFCVEEPAAGRAWIVEIHGAGSSARELRGETMRELTEMFAPALAELRPGDDDPESSARAALGGVFELLYEPLNRRDVEALRAVDERVADGRVLGLE